MKVPAYIHEGDDLTHTYHVNGFDIRYAARNVSRQGARITLGVNGVTLAWGSLAYEKDEDRVRLSNSAYRAWNPSQEAKAEWPTEYMKKGLDCFCEGLWAEVVSQDKGEMLAGDPDLGPPPLLLGNYIVKGGGTIIFAPPGRGKSYTALLMAVSLDAGVEKLWKLPHGPRRCGYINLERGRESMQRRLAAVNRALGLDPRRPLAFINARGRTFRDIMEAATETFREHGVQVVFLDSISRTGYGDLTADRSSNAVMDDLNRGFETWIALAHTPRQDETHAFGSVMFDGAADITVSLRTQTNEHEGCTGVGLQVEKANDSPRGGMSIISLEWNDYGLAGVHQAREHQFPDIEAGRKVGLREELVQLLGMVGEMSATAAAEELGRNRSNVSNMLRNDPAFETRRKAGNSVLYGLARKTLGNT